MNFPISFGPLAVEAHCGGAGSKLPGISAEIWNLAKRRQNWAVECLKVWSWQRSHTAAGLTSHGFGGDLQV